MVVVDEDDGDGDVVVMMMMMMMMMMMLMMMIMMTTATTDDDEIFCYDLNRPMFYFFTCRSYCLFVCFLIKYFSSFINFIFKLFIEQSVPPVYAPTEQVWQFYVLVLHVHQIQNTQSHLLPRLSFHISL